MVPRRLLTVVTAALCVVVAGSAYARAQDAGGPITPARLDFGELGPDSVSVLPLTIDNPTDQATAYDIATDGEVADWVTVHRDESDALGGDGRVVTVTVEPRATLDVLVRAEVPGSPAPGPREGAIRFIERVDGQAGTSVEIPVTIDVAAERVVAGTVVAVEAPDVTVGFRIGLQARIRNDGNTAITPDADIRVFAGQDEINRSFGRAGPVAPGREELLAYAVDTVLPQGDYRIEATFTAGTVALGTVSTDVSVTPLPGVTPGAGTPTPDGSSTGSGRTRTGLFIAGIVGLVAVVVGLALTRRRGPTALHADDDKVRWGRATPGRHAAKGDDDIPWDPPSSGNPPARARR